VKFLKDTKRLLGRLEAKPAHPRSEESALKNWVREHLAKDAAAGRRRPFELKTPRLRITANPDGFPLFNVTDREDINSQGITSTTWGSSKSRKATAVKFYDWMMDMMANQPRALRSMGFEEFKDALAAAGIECMSYRSDE